MDAAQCCPGTKHSPVAALALIATWAHLLLQATTNSSTNTARYASASAGERKLVGNRLQHSCTRLHGHAQVCASPLLGSALQSTHKGAAVATASAANGAGCPRPHRPDFRTQKRLIRVWRAALCHVSWMCKGAAAACVLLLPLAGLHLRHVRHQKPQRVTALGE